MSHARNSWSYELSGAKWAKEDERATVRWDMCEQALPRGAADAFKAAASEWSSTSVVMRFAAIDCDPATEFPEKDGYNRVDFGALEQVSELARSQLYFDRTAIVECDIRFNATLNWNFGDSPVNKMEWDFKSVALHEVGHCIGLLHVTDRKIFPKPVMTDDFGIGQMRRELTKDDIRGRNKIYGSTN